MGHTDSVLFSELLPTPKAIGDVASVESSQDLALPTQAAQVTSEELIRKLCDSVQQGKEMVCLNHKGTYQWAWVLNKTRHVSILEGNSALNLLCDLSFAVEEHWIKSERLDRLSAVVNHVGVWARFPGLLNVGMPSIAQLLLLVGNLVTTILWTYEHEPASVRQSSSKPTVTTTANPDDIDAMDILDMVLDPPSEMQNNEDDEEEEQEEQPNVASTAAASYDQQFTNELVHLSDLLVQAAEFLPGWMHWIECPKKEYGRASSSSSAAVFAAAMPKNDGNYRQVLFNESPYHRFQRFIPVIRSSVTHSFERPAMTFKSMDDVDHGWWRKRVYDTIVKQVDNTPGVSMPFKARLARILNGLLKPENAIVPITGDGENAATLSKEGTSRDFGTLAAVSRRIQFQSYWDQLLDEHPAMKTVWNELPDAFTAAADPGGFAPFNLKQASDRLVNFVSEFLVPSINGMVLANEMDDFRDFISSKLFARFELPRALSDVFERRSEVEIALRELHQRGALTLFRSLLGEAQLLVARHWLVSESITPPISLEASA
jgi:hypothetical protein